MVSGPFGVGSAPSAFPKPSCNYGAVSCGKFSSGSVPGFLSRGGSPSLQREGYRNCVWRFLLWGGDELMFVMPSWLAFAVVEEFFAATRDWSIDGHRLTHTLGLVICHYKTPIRQARALAHKIADEIKERSTTIGSGNAVGIEIFESLMPPEDDLSSHRARLYGAQGDAVNNLALDLAFPGEQFAELRGTASGRCRRKGPTRCRAPSYTVSCGWRNGKSPGLVSHEASRLVRQELLEYERRVRKAEAFIDTRPSPPAAPGHKGALARDRAGAAGRVLGLRRSFRGRSAARFSGGANNMTDRVVIGVTVTVRSPFLFGALAGGLVGVDAAQLRDEDDEPCPAGNPAPGCPAGGIGRHRCRGTRGDQRNGNS